MPRPMSFFLVSRNSYDVDLVVPRAFFKNLRMTCSISLTFDGGRSPTFRVYSISGYTVYRTMLYLSLP